MRTLTWMTRKTSNRAAKVEEILCRNLLFAGENALIFQLII